MAVPLLHKLQHDPELLSSVLQLLFMKETGFFEDVRSSTAKQLLDKWRL
jgi:hypothetical protein